MKGESFTLEIGSPFILSVASLWAGAGLGYILIPYDMSITNFSMKDGL